MAKRYLAEMASPLDRKKFNRAIRSVRGPGLIITTHEAPDADGIGSAFAIARKFRALGKDADIVGGPSIPPIQPLIETLGLELKSWSKVPQDDQRPVIVVDTSNPALLKGLSGRKNRVILLIDHHHKNESVIAADEIIENTSALSASGIIASLLKKGEVDRLSALALAVGIASDSELLKYVDRRTLKLFVRLLKISGESKSSIDRLAYPPMASDKLKKVIQDMGSLRVDNYRGRVISVGLTTIDVPSIFADRIRLIGASVSAGIYCTEGGWARVSIRVGTRDIRDQGIAANQIAYRASELCNMPKDLRGGGHTDKGGAHIRASVDCIIKAVMQAAKEAIDIVERKKK